MAGVKGTIMGVVGTMGVGGLIVMAVVGGGTRGLISGVGREMLQMVGAIGIIPADPVGAYPVTVDAGQLHTPAPLEHFAEPLLVTPDTEAPLEPDLDSPNLEPLEAAAAALCPSLPHCNKSLKFFPELSLMGLA
jgi:hypothetical protein